MENAIEKTLEKWESMFQYEFPPGKTIGLDLILPIQEDEIDKSEQRKSASEVHCRRRTRIVIQIPLR